MDNKTKKKRCSQCGREKPLAGFARNVGRHDGLDHVCRECRRQNYQDEHGGVQRALRKFTDAELIGEVLRRDKSYKVLESIDGADIVAYLAQLGFSVVPQTSAGGSAGEGGDV